MRVWIACALSLILASCGGGGSGSSSGTTAVTVSLGGVAAGALQPAGTIPANVVRAEVEALDAGGAVIVSPPVILNAANNFTAVVTVPNGRGIRMRMRAFDAAGNRVYEGLSAPQDLIGLPVTVPVKMNLTIAVTASQANVFRGGTVSLTATAAGAAPTANSPLLWGASGGAVAVTAGTNGGQAVWTAPNALGAYDIYAKVDSAVNPDQDPNVFGQVRIQVVNRNPYAAADTAVTQASQPVLVNVLANDGDPDGDALTLQSVTQPANGAASIVGGQVRYVPTAGFTGTDTLSYTVSDGFGGTATGQVTVTVNAVGVDIAVSKAVSNAAPASGTNVTWTLTATNNAAVSVPGVVVTDALPAGLQFVSATPAGAYDPATGNWTVGALAAGAAQTLAIVTRVLPGHVGVAIANTASLQSVGAGYVDNVAANDSAVASITPVANADLGLAMSVAGGTQPGSTVSYSLTVTNNGPDAVPAGGATVTDALPAGVAYAADTGGAATAVAANTVTWSVPALAAGASASLTITATVGQLAQGSVVTNTASVAGAADPNPANDAASASFTVGNALPVITAPAVNPYAFTMLEDGGTVSFQLSATDANGDPLTYGSATGAAKGQPVVTPNAGGALVSYTPYANLNGADSFTVPVSDGYGQTTLTVNVSITPVNDAPVFSVGPTVSGAAQVGNTLTVSSTTADVDGDVVLVSYQWRANGAAVPGATGANFTVTSAQAHALIDVYAVADDQTGAPNGRVSAVSNGLTVANTLPAMVPFGAVANVNEGSVLTVQAVASDADGDPYSFALGANAPAFVSLNAATGVLTLAPGFGDAGSYLVDVYAIDPYGSGVPATLNVTVANTNRAPAFVSPVDPYGWTLAEDTYGSLTVSASDPDGDAVTYDLYTAPANGTAAVDVYTGLVSYSPYANYNGPDAFVVRARDPYGAAALLHVNVTVTPVNDAPWIVRSGPIDTYTGVTYPLTSLDLYTADIDNPPAQLVYTLTQAPVLGTLQKLGLVLTVGSTFTQADVDGGVLRFVGNTAGVDQFGFTVTDNNSLPVSGSVAITVTSIAGNAPPYFIQPVDHYANPGAGYTLYGQPGQTLDLYVQAKDPDGGAVSFSISGQPTGGALTQPQFLGAGTAVLSYTPYANTTNDQFIVQVADSYGTVDFLPVQVAIAPLPATPRMIYVDPVAGNDTYGGVAGWVDAYATITQALSIAQPGDEIRLAATTPANPGFAESIWIDVANITISGGWDPATNTRGVWDYTVIQSPNPAINTVTVNARNVTLQQIDTTGGWAGIGILANGGARLVSHWSYNDNVGLQLDYGGVADLYTGYFGGNAGDGIRANGGSLLLNDVQLDGNGGAGLYADNSTLVQGSRVRAQLNGAGGLQLYGARVDLKTPIVINNQRFGVLFDLYAQGTITHGMIAGTSVDPYSQAAENGCGIMVRNTAPGAVQLANLLILGNGSCGLGVDAGASATAEFLTVMENGSDPYANAHANVGNLGTLSLGHSILAYADPYVAVDYYGSVGAALTLNAPIIAADASLTGANVINTDPYALRVAWLSPGQPDPYASHLPYLSQPTAGLPVSPAINAGIVLPSASLVAGLTTDLYGAPDADPYGNVDLGFHFPSGDLDDDMLPDAWEGDPYSLAMFGTDPTVADTDGDGYKDGFEVFVYGTDPQDLYSYPGAPGGGMSPRQPFAGIWHVDPYAGSDFNDGYSWATPLATLDEALRRAGAGEEIRLAGSAFAYVPAPPAVNYAINQPNLRLSGGWDPATDTQSSFAPSVIQISDPYATDALTINAAGAQIDHLRIESVLAGPVLAVNALVGPVTMRFIETVNVNIVAAPGVTLDLGHAHLMGPGMDGAPAHGVALTSGGGTLFDVAVTDFVSCGVRVTSGVLTATRLRAQNNGAGGVCAVGAGARATVEDALIVGNAGADPYGAGVVFDAQATGVVRQAIIAGNGDGAAMQGAGVRVVNGAGGALNPVIIERAAIINNAAVGIWYDNYANIQASFVTVQDNHGWGVYGDGSLALSRAIVAHHPQGDIYAFGAGAVTTNETMAMNAPVQAGLTLIADPYTGRVLEDAYGFVIQTGSSLPWLDQALSPAVNASASTALALGVNTYATASSGSADTGLADLGWHSASSDVDNDLLPGGWEGDPYGYAASITSPVVADSDGDGWADGFELMFGSDPTNSLVVPVQRRVVVWTAGPAQAGQWLDVYAQVRESDPAAGSVPVPGAQVNFAALSPTVSFSVASPVTADAYGVAHIQVMDSYAETTAIQAWDAASFAGGEAVVTFAPGVPRLTAWSDLPGGTLTGAQVNIRAQLVDGSGFPMANAPVHFAIQTSPYASFVQTGAQAADVYTDASGMAVVTVQDNYAETVPVVVSAPTVTPVPPAPVTVNQLFAQNTGTGTVISWTNGNTSPCNTRWTLAGSPYLVQSSVNVAPGCSLTIDPYVIVKFQNASLTVDGV
ncbi:MAG: tandem-95 repeat protein, partial [Mariprofundaceae bacterium]